MDSLLKKKMDSSSQVNKAIYSSVVGKCMDILKSYLLNDSEPSLEGFEFFYIRTKGIKPLVKSINMVMAQGYSLDDATDYVRVRVFDDTWNGRIWEIRAKNWLMDEYNLDCRFATWQEDSKHCVDLVGDKFAIQVKPITYKIGNNPSLISDRRNHMNQHRKYESITGKRVGHIFYNKKTNKLTLERYE